MKMQTVAMGCLAILFVYGMPLALGQEKQNKSDDAQPPKTQDKKSKPRFEPREKFQPDGQTTQRPQLSTNQAYVGGSGTFRLCGGCGTARFLWPVGGRKASFQEAMVFCYSSKDAVVYKLCGQYHRVYFAFGTATDASGQHRVWVRNGEERPWREFQSANLTK